MMAETTCVLTVSTCIRSTDPFVYFLGRTEEERKEAKIEERKEERTEERKEK